MATQGKILFQGGVSNVLFTDRREFYPEQEVFEYWKEQTQFLTWLNMLDRQSVPDPLFKMFQDSPTYVNQYFYVNGSAVTIAANGTESSAIAIDNITGLGTSSTAVTEALVGLVFEVWNSTSTTKKGQVFVSAKSSGTEVLCKTVKATAVTTADNDIFRCIGSVRGERSVAGESYFNELTTIWNSTHYFSLPIEITGKLYKETKLKGYSNELARLREKKIKEAKYQVQNAFLKMSSTVGTNLTSDGTQGSSDTFSEASLRTITDSASNSSDVRTTYGFITILEDYGTTWYGSGTLSALTNTFQLAASALDYNKMTDITQVIFDKRESDVIPGFCGYSALGAINKAVVDGAKFGFNGQFKMGDSGVNTAGFNFRNLETPFGIIQLVPMKALDNEYKGHILLPNDKMVGIREYEPWEYKTNIKTDNDYNGVKDVINYDAGFWLAQLPTHHMIVLK